MEVHFSPDRQAKLIQRANQKGRALDKTVQDVVARYFEEEDRFIEAVKVGEVALNEANFCRMNKWATGSGAFYDLDGNSLVVASYGRP